MNCLVHFLLTRGSYSNKIVGSLLNEYVLISDALNKISRKFLLSESEVGKLKTRKKPGCLENNFICSHGEAPLMWIDSVKHRGCSFAPCSSETAYLNKECESCLLDCNNMGWRAEKPRTAKLYYGDTARRSPYCKR